MTRCPVSARLGLEGVALISVCECPVMMPVAVEGCGQSFRLSHSHQELVEELTIQW